MRTLAPLLALLLVATPGPLLAEDAETVAAETAAGGASFGGDSPESSMAVQESPGPDTSDTGDAPLDASPDVADEPDSSDGPGDSADPDSSGDADAPLDGEPDRDGTVGAADDASASPDGEKAPPQPTTSEKEAESWLTRWANKASDWGNTASEWTLGASPRSISRHRELGAKENLTPAERDELSQLRTDHTLAAGSMLLGPLGRGAAILGRGAMRAVRTVRASSNKPGIRQVDEALPPANKVDPPLLPAPPKRPKVDDDTWDHIWGRGSARLEPEGSKIPFPRIRSGHHTREGMDDYLRQLSKVDPALARTIRFDRLDNDVVRAEIPKVLRSSKGNNARKTLFPESWDRARIERAVDAIRSNGNTVEDRGRTRVLEGVYDGVKVRVRVDKTQNEKVLTAFPSWNQ
jgi:hypothetical protein